MIFSDEPRFSKKLISHPVDGSISGVSKSATEAHVGPGSYLAQQFEERRSGWSKPSFSNRQPMQEPKNCPISRSDYYTSGVLSANGTMAVPSSPARSHSPGPGYYEGPNSVFSFPTDPHRRQDLNLTSMSGASVQNISTRPTTMASTPRFAFASSACINKGVLFQSATNENVTVGPGYYSVPRNDFLKRSYNIRARGSDNRIRSASSTPVTTPISSPVVKPVTQVRQISTPRGSYRPASASGTPNGSTSGSVNGSVNGRSQPGTPRSTGGTPQGTPVARPRSASASNTPRSAPRFDHLRPPPTATTTGAAAATTPTRTAPASRGKGLFSEHGSLDKPKTQQEWQKEQHQQTPI